MRSSRVWKRKDTILHAVICALRVDVDPLQLPRFTENVEMTELEAGEYDITHHHCTAFGWSLYVESDMCLAAVNLSAALDVVNKLQDSVNGAGCCCYHLIDP